MVSFRNHHVGFVFQAFNLVPSLNSIENVAVPMRSAGVRSRPATTKAVGLLEGVGLGFVIEASVREESRRAAWFVCSQIGRRRCRRSVSTLPDGAIPPPPSRRSLAWREKSAKA